MLWNRSLVMMDQETKSLWSHILGECMDGELKGAELEPLISDMVTWKAWKAEHPQTTVLNMSRTHKDFKKDFYAKPERFVLGWIENAQAYSASFAVLKESPVLNAKLKKTGMLVTFDAESTAARLFYRELKDGQMLEFEPIDDKTMRDVQTKSVWSKSTGAALSGQLKGTKLEPAVGIVSFTRAWKVFHPESVEVK